MTDPPHPPVLVELVRGGMVESTHTGSVVVLASDGELLRSVGVVDRPMFPRSANKPLQAVGLLDAGAPWSGSPPNPSGTWPSTAAARRSTP